MPLPTSAGLWCGRAGTPPTRWSSCDDKGTVTPSAGKQSRAGCALSTRLPQRLRRFAMTRYWGWRRWALIAPPFGWLAVFFLLPLGVVAAISLAQSADAIPPYTSLVTHGPNGLESQATLDNYRLIAGDLHAYLNSLIYAATATVLCLLVGYPIAFAIARAPKSWRNPLLFLVILPFWTSLLIRVYAWIAILQPTGLLNRALRSLGVIDAPILLINNDFSVVLGLVYAYLPFMILPLYGSLSQFDESLIEAAADLSARPRRTFLDVVLPLSLP